MAEGAEQIPNGDTPDAEEQIAGTQSGVQDLISQVSGITDTLNEAEAKLNAVSETIDSADEALSTIPGIMLEVTGLEEVPEVPEVAEVPAAPSAVAAATPVADAIAANSPAATDGDTNLNEEDIVNECTFEQKVVVGKFAVDDYNFETSTTDLLSSVDGASGTKMRMYEYPAGIKDSDGGSARSSLRIAEQEAFQKKLYGRSQCKAFYVGGKFELSEHEREAVNGKYILHSLQIEATPERYTNNFSALPDATVFRPPRNTKKPVIPGTQTAIVVGKDGEEIWTDEYGRVKVKFHWDQAPDSDITDGARTCWIRVAHGWAGNAWGMIFIPRIGMEVVVSFIDGDPDRPLITGMVYNAQQTVPYTLPDDQTKSTIKTNSSKESEDGFNELRFEDLKDSEEIYLHGQKDMNTRIENDLVEIIKHDRVELITNSHQVFVKKPDSASEDSIATAEAPELDSEAIDVIYVEGGNRKVSVMGADKSEKVLNEGTYEHTVGKTFTLTVKGDTITIEATGSDGSGDIIIKGKTISLESTSGDIKMKSAANMKMEAAAEVGIKAGTSLKMESGTDMGIKAGTDLKAEAGMNYSTKAGMNMKNEAGMNFDNKATMAMTNDGGIQLTNKASAMQTVDGGGMLTVKGGMVMIN